MSKGVPIPVAVRVKPLGVGGEGGGGGHSSTSWSPRAIEVDGRRFDFPSSVIPPEADQASVYQALMPGLIADFLDGYDVNFLAYGQTGSGKTHTIFGPPSSMGKAYATADKAAATGVSLVQPEFGVFPRGALEIFDNVPHGDAVLTGSMIELHYDAAFDLLNDRAPCSLDDQNTFVGVAHMPLCRPSDMLKLAAIVESRSTRATRMNDTSSRSHCITTLTLTRHNRSTGVVTQSKFSFFDLAGCERAHEAHDPALNVKSHDAGLEGLTVNWSLSQLALCVQARKDANGKKKGPWLPLRVCNLTRALGSSLAGNAKTGMVVTVSQAPRNAMQSALALRFGKDMADLRTVPLPNPSTPYQLLVDRTAKSLQEARTRASSGGANPKYVVRRAGEVQRLVELMRCLTAVQ